MGSAIVVIGIYRPSMLLTIGIVGHCIGQFARDDVLLYVLVQDGGGKLDEALVGIEVIGKCCILHSLHGGNEQFAQRHS